ncbi:MAG: hypothetical protein WC444_07320 [Candidatus Paceibacterota bacterium]
MPEPEKTDVTVDPSTTTDVIADSSTAEQEVQPEVTQEQVTQETPDSEGVKNPSIPVADDRPDRNLMYELIRKQNELSEKLSQITQTQAQPTQPQYGEAELTAFLSKPDLDDNTRLNIARELDRLRQRKEEDREKRITESLRTQSQDEVVRKQSYDFVSQNFPNCFVRDRNGGILGWNEQDPVTRQIGYYLNSNKELSKNPAGLMAAAKMAAFDLGISLNPKMQNKLNQTTAQLRKEQKKNLINGGTTVTVQKESSNHQKYVKLMSEYQKTGKASLLGEIMKLKGQFTPNPSEE